MNNNYTRPSISVTNWIVNKTDLRRLFDFFKKRNNFEDVSFELNTESGNNREYESFEEFEADINLLKKDKETISSVKMSCTNKGADGYGHIWIDINFHFQKNYFNIAGSDKLGEKKDWIDGSYEEMQRILKSFEVEDDKKKEVLKNKFGKKYEQVVLIEDFDGEKNNAIVGESLKSKVNDQLPFTINNPVSVVVNEKKKDWHEKPLGIIIIAVVGTILASGIIYFIGWK